MPDMCISDVIGAAAEAGAAIITIATSQSTATSVRPSRDRIDRDDADTRDRSIGAMTFLRSQHGKTKARHGRRAGAYLVAECFRFA